MRIKFNYLHYQEKWFTPKTYLVSYDIDSKDYRNRVVSIDFVPSKFWKFFGCKIIRRVFVGRKETWHEIVNKKALPVSTDISNVLYSGYISNEKYIRLFRKKNRR